MSSVNQSKQNQSQDDPVPSKNPKTIFLEEADEKFDCKQGNNKCNDTAYQQGRYSIGVQQSGFFFPDIIYAFCCSCKHGGNGQEK